MNRFRTVLRMAALAALCTANVQRVRAADNVISLAGRWSFRLDSTGVGEKEAWAAQPLSDSIQLPGSTAEAGYGDNVSVDTKWTGSIVDRSWFTEARYAKYRQAGSVKIPFWLQPVKHYVGPAWYQRKVTIPREWTGRRVVLRLERCHWETRVWVDGHDAGSRDSLAVAHEYDLTGLLGPGEHTLTMRVDNTVKIDVGVNAHSVSDHTQTNWNGIVGRLELRAGDPVYIQDVQVYPDLARQTARVRVTVVNSTTRHVDGRVIVHARLTYPAQGEPLPEVSMNISADPGASSVEIDYPMGKSEPLKLWDEFSPHVYSMAAAIRAGELHDERIVDFGMRQLGVEGTQFTINGRKTFVRGTLECCIFPLTGYPPTDVESWMRILKIAKAHGLNQFRFHSWCPPEAAFIAGDRMGFMHQVECCVWTEVGDGGRTDEFIKAEADRILSAYGNHPSFCFLAHGNEPGGRNHARFLADLVSDWKRRDPRRLYTSAAGWPLIPETDYHSTPEPRIQHWGAGLASRINAKPPETFTDYRDFVAAHHDQPVVSHEIGEWCVYPDFKEIAKYTGVLKARNFEIFRDGLSEHYMADQAEAFLIASGKLQTLCYKEEIESALRTPGFGGFQLLDLHDFPGQGTALVGVLNPFWESKGYVTPEEYHRFCCETVPLARMVKRTWTLDETLEAKLEVAHFGPAPIERAVVSWRLVQDNGVTVASGKLPAGTITIGSGATLETIKVPLAAARAPARLKLIVAIEGTPYANDWDLWVYPPTVDVTAPKNILVSNALDEQTLSALRGGGKVLLLTGQDRAAGGQQGKVPPAFSSIFWNTAWTRRQPPHTLGILCDPKHPALAEFPTEAQSNWQWWELIHNAQIMILDDLPAQVRPVVQVIDDWVTNRRLGLVLETQVEGGKLMVCGIDLETDLAGRPVARQMRASLMAYLQSDRFAPRVVVDRQALEKLLKGMACSVVKVDSAASGYEGCLAADGDPATFWHTPWEGSVPGYPHEIQLKMEKDTLLYGITYLPRQDMQNGWISRFEIYVSDDPARWGEPVAQGSFEKDAMAKTIRFDQPVRGRFARFVALKGFGDQAFAAVSELVLVTEPPK